MYGLEHINYGQACLTELKLGDTYLPAKDGLYLPDCWSV